MSQWSHNQSWHSKAEEDLYSAECLMEHYPTPYEVICYHCQQAVEKSLKSILSLCGEEVPKTHDCGTLCMLCMAVDPDFEVWKNVCSRFNPYGVIVRYPNELDVEESDAKWALKTSREILEFTDMKLEILEQEHTELNGGMEQTL